MQDPLLDIDRAEGSQQVATSHRLSFFTDPTISFDKKNIQLTCALRMS